MGVETSYFWLDQVAVDSSKGSFVVNALVFVVPVSLVASEASEVVLSSVVLEALMVFVAFVAFVAASAFAAPVAPLVELLSASQLEQFVQLTESSAMPEELWSPSLVAYAGLDTLTALPAWAISYWAVSVDSQQVLVTSTMLPLADEQTFQNWYQSLQLHSMANNIADYSYPQTTKYSQHTF